MNTRRLLVFFILYDEPLPFLASVVRTYASKQLNPVNDHYEHRNLVCQVIPY